MFVSDLKFFNFRGLSSQHIKFSSPFTLLYGQNGQGKTSVLEALFLLASGKSFRSGKLKDLLSTRLRSESGDSFSVCGCVSSFSVTKEIELIWKAGRRVAYIDGTRTDSAGIFLMQLAAVCFTAEDLSIAKGPPAVRRKFIDRLICQVDARYLEELVSYYRALKNRNAILSNSKTSLRRKELAESLECWDSALSQHGFYVAQRRKLYISSLSEYALSYYKILTSYSGVESIKLDYVGDFITKDGELISPNLFSAFLASNIERDLFRGRTVVGINFDDMQLSLKTSHFDFMPVRCVASQGQARSIAFAVVLGAVQMLKKEVGESPLVLLDDVESELDCDRLTALYAILADFDAQVIVTSTRESPSLLNSIKEVDKFIVKDGLLVRAKQF